MVDIDVLLDLVSPPSLEYHSLQQRVLEVALEVSNREPNFLSAFIAYYFCLKLILKFFGFLKQALQFWL